MKKDINWKTFQTWAVTAVGGNPHSRKQEIGKGENKNKKGLDGIVKAIKTNFNEDVSIEVKKHKSSIGINPIRIFGDKIRQRKLHNGIFISMAKLSSGAKERIKTLRDEGINIILITFNDLISPKLKIKLKENGIFPKKSDRVKELF